VDYTHYVSGTSGTSASPASATFSPNDQSITLSASVTTTAGLPINEGTETFTIYNGSQQIGQTTAAANVSNGNVSAVYTFPGGTPPGQYIIEADYSGSANYLPATDRSHFLTVGAAATVTTTTNASATFSAVADQTISLSAQVSSTAGAVNEGTVTFTILNGGNPVGSPVSADVTNNAASATYTLLANTPGGNYTIRAVYTDPVDFSTSTGTNTLAVAAAATTVAPSNAATTYSSLVGEGITLSANVTSAAGTIDQGSVAFAIFNSQNTQVVPTIYVSVANGIASSNYVLLRERGEWYREQQLRPPGGDGGRHLHHPGGLQRHGQLRRLAAPDRHPDDRRVDHHDRRRECLGPLQHVRPGDPPDGDRDQPRRHRQ
jgi:hypothetical protein